MALTPAERMRRYRARKAGGKTGNGKNLNKSAKLYLDEETQELIALLKRVSQNETLEQLFKRALFALSQQHFAQFPNPGLAASTEATELDSELPLLLDSNGSEILATMNQLQGKILLLESEYITPLKETVRQLQRKKTDLQQQITQLKALNQTLRKTALHFRQQRDAALQQNAPAIPSTPPSAYLALPAPGSAHSPQRLAFLHWLQAQRDVPYSWQEIAEALNQASIATPSGKHAWNPNILRTLLHP